MKFSKAKPLQDGTPQIDLAVPAFGYKNQVSIDRRHGLIRRWTAEGADGVGRANHRDCPSRGEDRLGEPGLQHDALRLPQQPGRTSVIAGPHLSNTSMLSLSGRHPTWRRASLICPAREPRFLEMPSSRSFPARLPARCHAETGP